MADEWVREGPYNIGPNSTAYPNRLIRVLSDDDALKNNLRWAQAAVNDAKGAVRVTGSSNKVMDVLKSLGGPLVCVPSMRSDWKGNLKPGKGWLHAITEIAAAARKHGCGNCGELSAIAFIYLYDRRIPVALDWMAIENGDHQFVLLDRAKGDARDPGSWGPRCVVADPWKDVVMPGSRIEVFRQGFSVAPQDNRLWDVSTKSYISVHREEA